MPRWIPLESNPELLTQYSHKLGLPSSYCLSEVFSPDLLDIVPSPRFAVIFLFPTTLPNNNNSSQNATGSGDDGTNQQPFFMRQTIDNACGTIALLHAFCNNKDVLDVNKGSFIDKYYNAVKDKSPKERGEYLEKSKELDEAQETFARQGQTSTPNRGDKVELHFVCFVEKEGFLYELDGRYENPTKYGKCGKDDLLQESFKVIQEQYMKKDPKETRFNVLALTPQGAM